jgi:oligopeptide transport system permease protein
LPRIHAGTVGTVILLATALPCLLTLPISTHYYRQMDVARSYEAPSITLNSGDASGFSGHIDAWIGSAMGRDRFGRSVLWRCLMGGAISLGVGLASALFAVSLGVLWGAIAGNTGGRTDAVMMRTVDVLYGLPYILLVVLLDLALGPRLEAILPTRYADVITLLIAIGLVSWLTMSRVIRGQVLSLRAQPFVEAARASGARPLHILRWHLLPNLVGPIIVYTTLTVPAAILQESFLSYLGIGISPPTPSWGNLAAEGVGELQSLTSRETTVHWWLVLWPCLLLGLTLLALNFIGDALRDRFDPKSTRNT